MSAARLLLVAAALTAPACVAPEEPPKEPIEIPFVVSEYYSPDGFQGDGQTQGNLTADKTCPSRAPSARGDCYTITYRPSDLGWAGINWQFPHNNWGQAPGHVITGGATRIVFQVRGSKGNEEVAFGAGQPKNANPKVFPRFDIFKIDPTPITLTSDWKTQEMGLGGYTGPDGVIGAFILIIKADANHLDRADPDAHMVFYLDDLQWVK